MCLNVTLTDSTYDCSATLPLDIVGVWTVRDRREQEPELQLVHSLKTVTDQAPWLRPSAPRVCVSDGGPV